MLEHLIGYIIPPLRILELAGNILNFQKWLEETHNKALDKKILAGYKFFLECTYRLFLSRICSNKEDKLEIEDDFLLECATAEGVLKLDKLPNTCDRIIFLKNIHQNFKLIAKAKSTTEISNGVLAFDKRVIQLFEKVFTQQFQLKKGINYTHTEAINILLIDHLYIYFTQINNNGPAAYTGLLLKNTFVSSGRLNHCLDGYKLTLQYLWSIVLTHKHFEKAQLHTLHLADSWRDYTYIPLPFNSNEYDLISREFELDQQTSLDSFFYRIKENIIKPLQIRTKLNIFNLNNYFESKSTPYSKNVFSSLLTISSTSKSLPKLNINEKIGLTLYWYPVEVFKPGQMHNGIAGFLTSLAGTVALNNKSEEKEFKKIVVSKFIHDLGDKKHNYSYGVLLDTKAAAGHYASGWLLYYDCCGDFSGFSSSQYHRAETLIKKYVTDGVIELRELKATKKALQKYILNHTSNTEGIEEIRAHLEEQSKKQKLKVDDILGKAKAIILEQLIYYAFSKQSNIDLLEWSTEKKSGEIDIVISTPKLTRIIECKVNPNNCDLVKEYDKLLSKLEKFDQENKHAEFWFWVKPSSQNIQLLVEKGIRYNYINGNIDSLNILKGVDLSNIKFIMNQTI